MDESSKAGRINEVERVEILEIPETPATHADEDGHKPAEPDSRVGAEQRLTASVLLLGGLALALLGQATVAVAVGNERFWIYLITGLGVAAFLLGGRLATRHATPKELQKVVDWVGDRLDIGSAQVYLLLMAFLFALLASFAAGEVLLARSGFVSTFSWLLALICAAAGMMRSKADMPPHLALSEIAFTTLLFGLAYLLRGLATDLIPTTFSGDEGAAGLTAVQFATGAANNLFTVGWFDFPSLYFALQGLGVRLLGQTVPALRIMSALGGALTVVAVYWLARATFDIFIARLSAIILLASHFHIHMSRIALNNIWDGFFAAAAALGLWYGWKSGRRIGFVISGLALGLGQYFYVTIRILPLLFLIWTAAAWLVRRERFRERLPGLLLAAYLALLTFLPMGLYYSRHMDQFMARIMPVTVSDDWLAVESTSQSAGPLQIAGQQILKAAGGFVYEPLRLLYDPGVPLLLITAAALFLIGLLWALLNPDLRYLLLLLPIAATIFIVAVSKDAPSSQRYIMAASFVVIFVALPLGLMREWLAELWPDYKSLAAVPAIIMVTWLAFADLRFYFTHAYQGGYILGGKNTLVATQVAHYLDTQDEAQDIYFFGFPRMGYRSHATIPYLAPQMRGHDIEPDGGIPSTTIMEGTTQFIFLPERLQELQQVLSLYPDGQYEEFFARDGELLFAVYEVGVP